MELEAVLPHKIDSEPYLVEAMPKVKCEVGLGVKPVNLTDLARNSEKYLIILYKVLASTKSLMSPRYARLQDKPARSWGYHEIKDLKQYSGMG